MEKYDIFLSYRRKNNGQRKAKRLAYSLEKRGYKVFLDVKSMHQGNYLELITNAVKSANDVILLMTEGYMDRCVNSDDVVALEILTAIRNSKNIILLNYNNEFDFSKWPAGLCQELDSLSNQNSISFVTNEYYEGPIKELTANRITSIPNENISLWSEYKTSDAGQKTINDFEKLQDKCLPITDFNNILTKYASKYQMNFEDSAKEDYAELYKSLNWCNFEELEVVNDDYETCFIYNLVKIWGDDLDCLELEMVMDNAGKGITDISLKELFYCTPILSIFLYRTYPEFFIPFFYSGSLYMLRDIIESLGYQLPENPKRLDHNARAMYYVKLSRTIRDIRLEKGMTPAEMCAYLYDYMYTDVEINETEDLPEPTNVWFMGGTNSSLEGLAAYKIWQTNMEAKRGDILVFYEKSPVSAINSIWRAHTDAIVEPYALYYSFVCAASPIYIKKDSWITKSDLESDDYFKNHKHVKKNMQGVSGWPMSAEDYKHLATLLSSKGFDCNVLPRLSEIKANTITHFEILDISKIGGRGYLVSGTIHDGYFSEQEEIRFVGNNEDFVCTISEIFDKKLKPLKRKIKDGEQICLLFNEAEIGECNLNDFSKIIKK